MLDQHCIAETLSHSEAVATLQVLLAQTGNTSRTAFSRHVCREFGFVDSRGQLQVASCQKALRSLHGEGRIDLPPPRHGGRSGDCRPRRLGQPVPEPQAVPAAAGAVAGLALTLVRSPQQRRTWNELVASEHPQGAVLHVGAQLRYLIESEHGVLGAIGFAAAALAVAARDEWIGWDAELRRKRLHRVLGLSRFLIRPSVRCQRLASKVLGMVLRRLLEDFRQRYGYSPWLVETYCDPQQHAGTCFRAANWTCVGETAGRGRFALPDQHVPVKAIFVYPLQRDWRRLLGADAAPPCEPLGPAEGLALDEFASNELGQAPLGDLRLSKRLVQSAQMQAAAPMASIPAAAQGQRAAVKGHYRLIDQPDESAVTPQNILAPHRQRTLRRLQAESVVLCVQDGTDLNFAEHPGCAGLGYSGKNKRSEGTLGLHMHSTLAVSAEGIPLGVLQIQYEAPDGQAQRGRPLQERKSFRWIRGLRDCAELAGQLQGARMVSVLDREADVLALFAEQRRLEGVELLVRAKHNRALGAHRPKLFEHMREQALQGQLQIDVQRSSARRGTRRQQASALREARTAQAELRWQTVELPAPSRREAALRLQLVHVWERSAPEGVEALEWFLLTTLPVASMADAEQVLEWYRLRWRIEDRHRILKSGCKVEYLGHRTGERIERAVTIKAVIAWRLAAMTLLGRETPELPAAVFFTQVQLRVLRHFASKRGLAEPGNLGLAVRTLAILGGYLYRKNAPPPGHQKIWEGWTRLTIMSEAYELRDYFEPPAISSQEKP